MRSAGDTLTELIDDDLPTPPGGKRRRIVAGAFLLLLLGVILTGLLIAFSGGEKGATSALPDGPRPLDGAARELMDLMAKGQEGTYHARYSATSPEQPGITFTIEIWRKGSLTRQDSVASDGTQTVHTAAFALPSGNRACRQESGGPWNCVPVTGARTTTEQLTELATTELSGRSVSARDETIAGRPARCFTIVGEGQSSELCLSQEGVALRVGSGNTRLELIALEGVTNDDAFRPPV